MRSRGLGVGLNNWGRSCRAVTATDACPAPWTHARVHGLGGKRRGGYRGELSRGRGGQRSMGKMATMTNRSKPPLYYHGRAMVCISEEAAGGGEGSIGTAMARCSHWTLSRALRQQEGAVPKHKQCSGHATLHRAHAQACHYHGHRVHWHEQETKGWQTLSSGKFLHGRSQLRW